MLFNRAAIRSGLLHAAADAYGALRFGRSTRLGLRILMYHAVGTPVADDAQGLYNMPFGRFESQMRYLKNHYAEHFVPLDCNAFAGNGFRIAITFDDGYRDNLLVAAPLLVELGIPFTVFVCTGAVSERKDGFLSPEDLRELSAMQGVKIGSHSVNHLRLTAIDDRAVYNEVECSKAYLEDLLGRRVDSIAYPRGDVNKRVRDIVASARYEIGATSRFDINQANRDALLLCRTDIWAGDDIMVFGQKLRGDWDWMRWRHPDPSAR